MITLTEPNNTAIIYTDELDSSSEGLIRALCKSPAATESKIRIMPDVHPGKGCVIGTTMTITDKVIPFMVGVDIGCGVNILKFAAKRIDFQKLDKTIQEKIPHGAKIRQKVHKFADSIDFDIDRLYCRRHIRKDRALQSIGTLGGGNHYIEIDKDSSGDYYLNIHSGSRGLGLEVAEYYQDQAFKNCSEGTSYELAYVEGDLMQEYLHDMEIVQNFASVNRRAMISEILDDMKFDPIYVLTTVHNYIDTKMMILRKGAVSAQYKEKLVIPLNMRDGCLICSGKGNIEWNCSAPHGAGRLYGRKEARESLTLTEYKKQMEGIYSTSVSRATIDESPMAYKPIDDILSHIGATVEIVDWIKPVYNFKSKG